MEPKYSELTSQQQTKVNNWLADKFDYDTNKIDPETKEEFVDRILNERIDIERVREALRWRDRVILLNGRQDAANQL